MKILILAVTVALLDVALQAGVLVPAAGALAAVVLFARLASTPLPS